MTPIGTALQALAAVFTVYAALAVSHFAIQLVYAHKTHRHQRSDRFQAAFPPNDLSVDVIVPVYNEAPADLEACTSSILRQQHRGTIRLIVIDDGSTNRADLMPVYGRLRALGVTVILAPRNGGKREAQYLGFQELSGEIVVTVDSDTRLAPDAVAMISRQFSDPKVGAITGNVQVTNHQRNLLTRLIDMRYWMAFHQERAAQSWFRTVLCCSGPLSAYRRTIIEHVMDTYISQTFRGVRCTYGDDRHLTNLVLTLNFDTVVDAGARATTAVPETIGAYLRQQLRWNKSFYRELQWTAPFVLRRPWYIWFDLGSEILLPALLLLSVLSIVAYSLTLSIWHLIRWVAFVAAFALIRATYGALRERRAEFYLFVLYGFVHASLLIPTRALALLTLRDNRWGTR